MLPAGKTLTLDVDPTARALTAEATADRAAPLPGRYQAFLRLELADGATRVSGVDLTSGDALTSAAARGLVLVGTADTNPLVARHRDRVDRSVRDAAAFVARASADVLVLSGRTPLDAEHAAMDFVVRFWSHAKAPAARRIGLVAKPLPLGVDPGSLPDRRP